MRERSHGRSMTPPPYRRLSALAGICSLAILLSSCTTVPQSGADARPALLAPLVDEADDWPVPNGPVLLQLKGSARQGSLLRGLAPAGTTQLLLDGEPVPFDTEGNFIIAFDRDAKPSANLIAKLVTGKSQTRTLSVARGDWRIQNVDASITGSASSEEFQEKRAEEVAQINAARNRHELSNGWRQTFIWPVKARISGVFGSQRIYRGTPGSYHSGLDLAGGAGTTYVAPADGVVVLASDTPFTLEGKLLMINHGMGLVSAFLHNESLLVKEGDVVHQGQPLGRIGATGRVTGPHLHWGLRWNEARIDPLLLLDATQPR